ncbi:MAG: DUF4290 domain-containing protein [Bacteroidales bacterium]|nr:DUF4290 domain-containing protein [Bacteroidales bacterium]
MEYFTGLKNLVLPEYGRNIQNMVDHALTIEDRAERTRCAKTIINLMGNMFPHLRNVEDFKYKLWDHLAIMADFQLDIDYPYEIVKKENLYTRPDTAPYKSGRIKYRHYGMVIENMIQKVFEYPEGSPEREQLILLVANHMKKSYISWNKEGVDDAKIFQDLAEYTKGKLTIALGSMKLFEIKDNQPRLNKPKMNNNNMKKQGKN